jgi:hypothetical protein
MMLSVIIWFVLAYGTGMADEQIGRTCREQQGAEKEEKKCRVMPHDAKTPELEEAIE